MKLIFFLVGQEGVVGGFVEEGQGVFFDDIVGFGEGVFLCIVVVGVEAVVVDLKRLNIYFADSAGVKNWLYL